MATASAATPGSTTISLSTVERRKKVVLGELPADFLRVLPPGPAQHQQQQQQQMDPDELAARVLQQQLDGQLAMRPYAFVPPNTRGRLSITVVEGKLAKNYGLVRMDPYCRMRVGNTVFETPTNVNGGKAPKWNRTVHSYLPQGVETMFVELFDERAFTMDERIAWSHVPIPPAVFNGETIDDWYPLSGQQGEGKEGMINLIIAFAPVDTPVQYVPQHFVGPDGQPAGVVIAGPQGLPGTQPVMPVQPQGPLYTEEDAK
uniref:C2 domain-containing protein n=1 Tax=Plectus sambesii TaxID=2011161 RepID=A0A914URQ8_9BILA